MTDKGLVCPRCGGEMITFNRAGVQVDQCQTCKGIFLDRGELEQLVQAEQSFYAPPPPPQAPPPGYQQPGYPPPGYPPPPGYGYGGHHGGHPRRRRGFLGELFDD